MIIYTPPQRRCWTIGFCPVEWCWGAITTPEATVDQVHRLIDFQECGVALSFMLTGGHTHFSSWSKDYSIMLLLLAVEKRGEAILDIVGEKLNWPEFPRKMTRFTSGYKSEGYTAPSLQKWQKEVSIIQ